jgi:hypothetical protein
VSDGAGVAEGVTVEEMVEGATVACPVAKGVLHAAVTNKMKIIPGVVRKTIRRFIFPPCRLKQQSVYL